MNPHVVCWCWLENSTKKTAAVTFMKYRETYITRRHAMLLELVCRAEIAVWLETKSISNPTGAHDCRTVINTHNRWSRSNLSDRYAWVCSVLLTAGIATAAVKSYQYRTEHVAPGNRSCTDECMSKSMLTHTHWVNVVDNFISSSIGFHRAHLFQFTCSALHFVCLLCPLFSRTNK